MSAALLEPLQTQALERLCQWDDPGHCAQGMALAASLFGDAWESLDPETLLSQETLSGLESIRLCFAFAEAMQAKEIDEEYCLTILPKLRANPTLTRQLLLDWPRAGSYTYPSYDLGWHLVNMGLFQARQLADPQLFGELLTGVSVGPAGDGFFVDAERAILPVQDGFDILIQHEIRGLVGYAPPDCLPAMALRQGLERLRIRAGFDTYKWEREFPVDCSPLASFNNLASLEICDASPLLNWSALDHCDRLHDTTFTNCHLPWAKDTEWSLSELRAALDGQEPRPPPWKSDNYICLDTGHRRFIARVSAVFHDAAEPPPPRCLDFATDSLEARMLRLLLSEQRAQRRDGLALAKSHPDTSRQVVWAEVDRLEDWGHFPRFKAPHTPLVRNEINEEILELVLARDAKTFAALQKLQMECPWLESLDFLQLLPNLRALELKSCAALANVSGFEFAKNLRHLDLGGTAGLRDLAGLEACQALVSCRLKAHKQLDDLTALASLDELRQLALPLNEFTDLSGLPHGLRLERLDLHACPSLEQLAGIERIQASDTRQPLRVNLRDCTQLSDVTGLGGDLTNVHVNLANCRSLVTLSGLEQAENLEKLLLIFVGCDALEDISALNHLPKLRKLHLNLADLSQAPTLIDGLALGEEVKLVLEERFSFRQYPFR